MQVLNVTYTTIKTVIPNIPSYYVPRGTGYSLFSVGDEMIVQCILLPTATVDIADFEANHKSSCTQVASIDDARVLGTTANGVPLVAPRSLDGRLTVRTTTANKTRNFNLKVFSFIPGQHDSVVNKNVDFTDCTDVLVTCYDAGDVVTTDPTQAVKTVVDWEPTYNYEVIGGWVDVPPGIVGTATDVWYVTVIGVPDIPRAYGGSVPFVYPCDISLVTTMKVVSDGRATQYLAYNATYHTNKLRWIFKHPVSASNPRFQIYIDTFT